MNNQIVQINTLDEIKSQEKGIVDKIICLYFINFFKRQTFTLFLNFVLWSSTNYKLIICILQSLENRIYFT